MSRLILPRRFRPPNDQRGFIINPYVSGTAPASLSSLILAKNPVIYWRHNEASGTSMVDSSPNGRSGTYIVSGASPIPQTAIYTGGPTCMLGNGSGQYGFYGGSKPALNDITIVTIFRPNSTTGFRSLISRDDNSTRFWQWRMNGTSLEWVKIVGGVSTTTQASVFTIGVTSLIAITISAAGALNMYQSSGTTATPIKTAAIAGANYGAVGDNITVGYCLGVGTGANGYFSESAIFNTVLTGADIASFATAAGL